MDLAVVIPVFNRSEMLERAVQSVLNQELLPAELVVVNDGSQEDLSEMAHRLSDAGYRWLDLRDNQGVAAARNAGVAATSARWICFLDSDDEWKPEKLSRQWTWHRDHPEMRISQVREEWIRCGRAIRKPDDWEPEEGDLSEVALRRCAIGPSCVMIRRDLWEEFGGFDPRYRVCEDYELWLRITRENIVGLVGGGPLAKKHGGHPDQLSITTPAMDRHRIVALLELLARGKIGEAEAERVAGVIREKCGIVSGGAAKRGHTRRAAFYRELSGADLRVPGRAWDALVSAAWLEALRD